ncbi:uroporphyrinogen-III C-methyltransferase [Nafulsella turpanensis]|uniref:uroporphyrinogen-III C-methyltransferase n=1 Tax=Nafulsella turpanensis TaxID=1265690 RepID=UPI0003492C48|nr:uroporphyrinogen-III C-methyltransferase [Nafulsella turpanensis]
MMTGKLTLVGAGPGDPELITLKGIKALADADVVLYDALVHPEVLEYAKKSAEKIFVGKRAGRHSLRQEEINQLIVEKAVGGKHVVRLKGGDPFIFARGKEELEYAETFGISTEVVLGISSINLPGYYGIPLTRRGINESFWAITATTKEGVLSADVALAAQSSATVVLFMGLGKLEEISRLYQKQGKGQLPAAIISKGSLEEGLVYFATVSTLVNTRNREKIAAPALLVIGEAVGTHEFFYEKVRKLNVAITPQNPFRI